jgi:TPR repeat protein
MRTSESLASVLIGAFVGAALLGAAPAHAFDGTPSPKQITPGEAFRQGARSMRSGDARAAFNAFLDAARQGHTASAWRVGRMLLDGASGVERDELQAFHWFSQIVERHADDDPTSPTAQITSRAFVELGTIRLTGIPGSEISRDYPSAWRMFYHAASVFRDQEAQYQLGRMYLNGQGIERSPRLAAQWLRNAAEKGHRAATATLGELMFVGAEGMPRRPVDGLAMLTVARHGADPERDSWIIEAFDDAFTLASDDERIAAAREARRHMRPAASAPQPTLPTRIP